ncbi:hypothetical protein EJ05DRAFT_483711 [Pseudovirgaria hyperparasitica]|uniref:HNH nuclease domain-containing protein n=1 Tax=Pseudovirgaria hyperparasitica TaxID=470096 RepID=A0A6A6WJ71_9PEZI|nr:uncharacterized protein EJ05DRAFT_483711 [Pseudovirgaria hyperparasitica]KAF2761331.1 hypothetical protein EJ05DRAFT_483711 [Pseudovirgaria hyperparasitica]
MIQYRVAQSSASFRESPSPKKVYFCHPGYCYPRNTLIVLPAVDKSNNGAFGIHLETARLACGILAGNEFIDTFFTENEPNVLTFDDWPFPHDRLPHYWKSLYIPPQPDRAHGRYDDLRSVFNRDISCRVTGHQMGTQKSHLIHSRLLEWFDRNNMEVYKLAEADANELCINSPANVVVLRADIHTLLDSDKMTILPKHIHAPINDGEVPIYQSPSQSTSALSLVLHVIRPDTAGELTTLYQNTSLHRISGISVQYLFAAYAIKVFSLATFFKHDGLGRTAWKWNLQTMKLEEADVSLPPRKPRSSSNKRSSKSPTKRSRTEGDVDDDDNFHSPSPNGLSRTPSRGRKRYRDSDLCRAPEDTQREISQLTEGTTIPDTEISTPSSNHSQNREGSPAIRARKRRNTGMPVRTEEKRPMR